MATHSSTLAWKIPWTEDLVGCSPWDCEESDMPERLHFHALEEEVAAHSSVLAWRIPGIPPGGGLPSMESHRVWHDWSDLAAAAAAALPLELPGKPSNLKYLIVIGCISILVPSSHPTYPTNLENASIPSGFHYPQNVQTSSQQWPILFLVHTF